MTNISSFEGQACNNFDSSSITTPSASLIKFFQKTDFKAIEKFVALSELLNNVSNEKILTNLNDFECQFCILM